MPVPDSPTIQPEHWQTDVGSASVAVLNIPGLLSRARVFDVDVTLVVDVPSEGAKTEPWHELTVEFDGQRQWNRRFPSHSPGQTDGLDYHHRVRLEAEQALRVRAVVKVKGSRIRSLMIEAREEL
ncbi:hypothetical protein LPB72_11130 [Hydrogenophaga crassostreae]|uniref:Uncharacterized protein n=1 Tax=Hydrogenophaga crassostreae TaxID=1763535 RepID=A0A162P6J5_9BURK|nr:hypothetical protein [Hydrogenophaga crassostreae]AOW13551.1 hypothetical protein LPB072_12510 [Hydrogenophaga crassostreae]OAD41844.1 hypothetical protein LPB72_11130 [Hydrogenophaga crassostreae]